VIINKENYVTSKICVNEKITRENIYHQKIYGIKKIFTSKNMRHKKKVHIINRIIIDRKNNTGN
jgi:hypothetical protein